MVGGRSHRPRRSPQCTFDEINDRYFPYSIKQPGETLSTMMGRVGLGFGKITADSMKRKNAKAPGDQTLPAASRAKMDAFYAPYNAELREAVCCVPARPSVARCRGTTETANAINSNCEYQSCQLPNAKCRHVREREREMGKGKGKGKGDGKGKGRWNWKWK